MVIGCLKGSILRPCGCGARRPVSTGRASAAAAGGANRAARSRVCVRVGQRRMLCGAAPALPGAAPLLASDPVPVRALGAPWPRPGPQTAVHGPRQELCALPQAPAAHEASSKPASARHGAALRYESRLPGLRASRQRAAASFDLVLFVVRDARAPGCSSCLGRWRCSTSVHRGQGGAQTQAVCAWCGGGGARALRGRLELSCSLRF